MTVRSRAMQRFRGEIVNAMRSGKGIALIVAPESSHELSSLIEMIALQRNTRTPHAIHAPVLNLMDSDRGLLIRAADQIPAEHQERLLAWMGNRGNANKPVFAVFTTNRRWRYCTKRDSRPPTSQRERVERWSAELMDQFASKPLSFPELHDRASDVMGILFATIEALGLDAEQADRVKDDAFINALLHDPPKTVLLLVNQICDAVPGILQPVPATVPGATPSLRQPALPTFGD